MSVGFSVDKATIDSRAGSLPAQLRDTFTQINNFKTWLDSATDDYLTGLGYTTDDVTLLRAAFGDLSALSAVAHAQQALAEANDFFFNAKKLTGVN